MSNMETDNIVNNVDNYKKHILVLQSLIKPLLLSDFSELYNNMDPLERSRLQLLLSYVSVTFYGIYARSLGSDDCDEIVKSCLSRLSVYFDRIQNLENCIIERRNDNVLLNNDEGGGITQFSNMDLRSILNGEKLDRYDKTIVRKEKRQRFDDSDSNESIMLKKTDNNSHVE